MDVDHDDGAAVPQRRLVRGEIDQLVHQREIERPPQPPEPARDLAGPVHPIGTFLAAQDLEVAVG